MMRQYAYLGEDGQVHVHDLDSDQEQIVSRADAEGTEDAGGCACPTWSPDGTQLAYVRYEVTRGELRASALHVALPDGTQSRLLHRFEGSLPIYMSWSPDGRRLALLLQTGRQLALHIVDAVGHGPLLVAARGAPLYFAWHPDSNVLLTHAGRPGPVPGSRLAWVRLEADAAVSESLPVAAAPAFRAPAWWTVRGAMTVARGSGDSTEVVLVRPDTPDVEVLFACGAAPAFAWSPNGDILACAGRKAPEDASYEGISLFRPQEGKLEKLTEASALAFFWASGGRRLVYCTDLVGDRQVGLRLLDIESGGETDLGFVRPSREQLLLFSHFDQYRQSALLVSPSGNELLLAASRAKESENGSVPTVRQIMLKSLGPESTERPVGRGRLAFWRPAIS
ncbi:MAG TPA: hypothetical protein VGK54_10630 [Chloroflexota bacterium]